MIYDFDLDCLILTNQFSSSRQQSYSIIFKFNINSVVMNHLLLGSNDPNRTKPKKKSSWKVGTLIDQMKNSRLYLLSDSYQKKSSSFNSKHRQHLKSTHVTEKDKQSHRGSLVKQIEIPNMEEDPKSSCQEKYSQKKQKIEKSCYSKIINPEGNLHLNQKDVKDNHEPSLNYESNVFRQEQQVLASRNPQTTNRPIDHKSNFESQQRNNPRSSHAYSRKSIFKQNNPPQPRIYSRLLPHVAAIQIKQSGKAQVQTLGIPIHMLQTINTQYLKDPQNPSARPSAEDLHCESQSIQPKNCFTQILNEFFR